jgi:dihydropteroate synthase
MHYGHAHSQHGRSRRLIVSDRYAKPMTFICDPFASFVWRLAHGRSLELGPKALIMGILNVTPDSFSDGGVHLATDAAIRGALAMAVEGAAIIDIGGESTRPGAMAVSEKEEQARVLPVVRELAKQTDLLLSIDTVRASTARLAVAEGAHIVNDVWGLQRDPDIAGLVAETGAGLVIMHTGRERQKRSDVFEDQFAYLRRSLEIAENTGIRKEAIVLDPGFGFAKDPDENLALLSGLSRLLELGHPLLVGASRKRFLGHVTGREAGDRDIATAATSVVARLKGAAIFRVHNVRANRDALAIADAVREAKT